jgi:hypothetical protein
MFCSKCGARLAPQNAPAQSLPPVVPVRKTDGLAVAALVLGIGSFLPTFAICSIPAIVMGAVSLNKIKKDPALEGKGMALAGLICGSVVVFLWICLIIFLVVFSVTQQSSNASGVSVSLLARGMVF